MAKNWSEIDGVVAEMKAKGVLLNAMTYTALITGCALSQQSDRARGYLEDMQAAGMEPNVYTSSAMITAYTKSGEWEAALQVCLSCAC